MRGGKEVYLLIGLLLGMSITFGLMAVIQDQGVGRYAGKSSLLTQKVGTYGVDMVSILWILEQFILQYMLKRDLTLI